MLFTAFKNKNFNLSKTLSLKAGFLFIAITILGPLSGQGLATGSLPTVYLSPASQTVNVGNTFNVQLRLIVPASSGTQDYVQSQLSFPSNVLAVQSISDSGTPDFYTDSETFQAGYARIVRTSLNSGGLAPGDYLVATITFTAVGAGSGVVAMDSSYDSYSSGTAQSNGGTYTVSSPATPPPSPSPPSPSPSPNPKPTPPPASGGGSTGSSGSSSGSKPTGSASSTSSSSGTSLSTGNLSIPADKSSASSSQNSTSSSQNNQAGSPQPAAKSKLLAGVLSRKIIGYALVAAAVIMLIIEFTILGPGRKKRRQTHNDPVKPPPVMAGVIKPAAMPIIKKSAPPSPPKLPKPVPLPPLPKPPKFPPLLPAQAPKAPSAAAIFNIQLRNPYSWMPKPLKSQKEHHPGAATDDYVEPQDMFTEGEIRISHEDLDNVAAPSQKH